MATEDSARRYALIACMSASNALCRTQSTFSGSGREATHESNNDFDLVWHAQLLLTRRGLYDGPTNGIANDKMQGAILEFLDRIGAIGFGNVYESLLQRMIDANGGPREYATVVRNDLLPIIRKQLTDASAQHQLYSYSGAPASAISFSDDLEERSEGDRLRALATFISARQRKCTAPARSAIRVTANSWSITCNEGTFTLFFGQDGIFITGGSGKPAVK